MDSSESKLEKFLNQLRNNDVDVKIDALNKLQAEADAGIEIDDPEALINVLKPCLRTSNQHLSTATLSVLPTVIPLLVSRPFHLSLSRNGQSSVHSSTSSSAPTSIVDLITLRHVLNAFLPSGGLFDRLGDKEKAQLKAREALVALGALAFRASGQSTLSTSSRAAKGPETPLAMYERFLRESGLSSKVWKVREQSILILVHIRRQHHMFPIRSYLPLLVGCLEDTDAHVRECARQSVVELFTGPAVTDAARADLKKEMTKRGVRKTIIEGVLSKLLGSGFDNGSNPASREGSENGDARPKEYVPPSIALQQRKASATSVTSMPRTTSYGSVKEVPRPLSRAAAATPPPAPSPTTESSSDVSPVYIASAKDLETEFSNMAKPFEGKETEHNWALREQAILRVRGMLKGDVHRRYSDIFLASLKEFIQWSLKTLTSLRTTVAVNTCNFYCELAAALGHALDPFCEILVTNLLRMAGFTKKMTAQQSQVAVTALITHTSGNPRIFVTPLWQILQEKSVQARTYAVRHFKTYLETHGQRVKHAPEADVVEKAVRKALSDGSPLVKEIARACFWVFESVWKDLGLTILSGLDATARKQLEKACPDPNAVPALPATGPTPAKKSSVAAAIAASRAKAKAIAAAPPTLRHQATSASHAPVRRPSSPGLSKSVSSTPVAPRPSSPLRMSASPPSPRTRVASSNMVRTASAPISSQSHSRNLSNASAPRPASPPSPSADRSMHRRTSSPLAQPSTLRRAMQTALPASPPSATAPQRQSVLFKAKPVSTSFSAAAARSSILPVDTAGMDDDSLLLAQAIPLPEEDSDSDPEHSVNLLSFSGFSPQDQARRQLPPAPASNSQTRSLSPRSADSKAMIGVSNALSTDSVADLSQVGGQPLVEDALRARAEQAESAAERLLELVEPEEEGLHHHSIPPSLLVGSSGNATGGHSTPKVVKALPLKSKQAPLTPVSQSHSHAAMVMRQAALFRDSPIRNGKPASLLDMMQEKRVESGWWLKRRTILSQRKALLSDADINAQLQTWIQALDEGTADQTVLRQLVYLCLENPAYGDETGMMSPLSPDVGLPGSPSPFVSSNSLSSLGLHADLWEKNRNFDRLFTTLIKWLGDSIDRDESDIEHGLMVLWQMHESLGSHLEGHEADLFGVLLRVRYCNKFNILEATNAIRDALTNKLEPVYGLTTMHASLKTFQAEVTPPNSSPEMKAVTYAFGLIALGKFILRLPAEIAEEELPRIRGTLISGLNEPTSLVVREAAAAAIISAQVVLQDETHLFTLLDGLADEKKNLLTYLFDKHGARGSGSGMEKLQKELRRLDTRTSTPPRAQIVAS
ncbi:heat repeat containing protein [Moniliophthora roreri MCA 2997]|uniref:Heat repeat containing protein n=2 Tax=Moniliophthora roreri TaxID=221103 RepID=V2Z0H5_MONRO|nr:heat repeat containing protein [Moniliophthora roreri MCA 2997]